MNFTELTVQGEQKLSFASDNCAGAHPEVIAALTEANAGHQMSYGADAYTERLQGVLRHHFGDTAEGFPVFNGTGANVVALQSVNTPWGAIICSSGAHINTDEGAAPERVASMKLLPVTTPDGKLTPELIASQAHGFGDQHHAQPTVVSLTQATELGTVYTAEEIRAICECAHSYGMIVHVDGARLANAAAFLDLPLRAFTTDAGVDILSFGGTKNGLVFGELVVVLNPELAEGLKYIRKFDMQLASKMRYISAQFIALLEDDLWLESARRANARAALLAELAAALPEVTITQPVQANAVFAQMPPRQAEKVGETVAFHPWNAETGELRWMCSHDTTEDDVREFARRIGQAAGSKA